MGIPEQPEDEMVGEAPDHLDRPRSYTAVLSRRGRVRADNDNLNATERFVFDILHRHRKREPRPTRPMVPRSGRWFVSTEVRRARRSFFLVFGLLLGLWLATFVGLLALS
jgi:hypothetical protein